MARGEACDAYLTYCLKYVRLLQQYNISCILVFDGAPLPAKQASRERVYQLLRDTSKHSISRQ